MRINLTQLLYRRFQTAKQMWIKATKSVLRADLTSRKNLKCQRCLSCLQKHNLKPTNPFNKKNGVGQELQSGDGGHQKEIEDRQNVMIASIKRDDIHLLQVHLRLTIATEVGSIGFIIIDKRRIN